MPGHIGLVSRPHIVDLELYAHYDFSDPTTVTQSSGFVDALSDKSGNGFHTSQTGGARPKIGVETLNGLDVGTWDANYQLSVTAGVVGTEWNILSDGTSYICMAVFKCTPDSGNAHYICGNNAGTSNGRGFGFVIDNFANTNLLTHWISANSPFAVNNQSASNFATSNTWHIGTIQHFGGSVAAARSTLQVDNTGVEVKNNASTSAYINAAPTFAFTIGRSAPGGNFAFRGSIGEILLGTNTAKMDDMYAYLASKWGL